MEGHLQAKSHLGKGSTFWFDITVPIVALASSPTVVPEREITGYTGERQTILIADDQEYNRLVLMNLLEPLGFEIVTADDGRKMIDKARHIRPDVILTDLVMPVMTGFDAVREIRRIPELQHVYIIAVSASVFDTDQQHSTLAGCDDFLAKPVNAGELFNLLATHLNLEWIYERPDGRMDSIQELQSDLHHLTPPPSEELHILYTIARWGNMRRIREQASRIEHMDPRYKLFTDTLQQFAKEYKEEEIRSFLQQYIGEGQ
jgi:CheY-like chemotaxis protein